MSHHTMAIREKRQGSDSPKAKAVGNLLNAGFNFQGQRRPV